MNQDKPEKNIEGTSTSPSRETLQFQDKSLDEQCDYPLNELNVSGFCNLLYFIDN